MGLCVACGDGPQGHVLNVVEILHDERGWSLDKSHGCHFMLAGVLELQLVLIVVTYPERSSWALLIMLKPKRYPWIILDRKSRKHVLQKTSPRP